jgi:phosphoglycolate phosphatase-like HAD superfamily hydrolase
MRIKAVIHDWDDTITNSFESYTKFYFDLGKYYQFNIPDVEKIKKHWGGTIPDIVKGIWPELPPQEAEEKTKAFLEYIDKCKEHYPATVFPKVKETIFYLHNLGIKLGVISSGSSAHIKHLFKTQIDENLHPHCFIYDHNDLGYKKPDPRVFDKPLEYLQQFGITTQETIYVGDSFQDYEAARNCGLTFYAVTTGLKTKKDFIDVGLDTKHVLNNFNDLTTLF